MRDSASQACLPNTLTILTAPLIIHEGPDALTVGPTARVEPLTTGTQGTNANQRRRALAAVTNRQTLAQMIPILTTREAAAIVIIKHIAITGALAVHPLTAPTARLKKTATIAESPTSRQRMWDTSTLRSKHLPRTGDLPCRGNGLLQLGSVRLTPARQYPTVMSGVRSCLHR
jgi:hypothetical protein